MMDREASGDLAERPKRRERPRECGRPGSNPDRGFDLDQPGDDDAETSVGRVRAAVGKGLKDQRGDGHRGGEGGAHAFASEGFDIPGGVADEEEAVRGDGPGVAGEADRAVPAGVGQGRDGGKSGLVEDRAGGLGRGARGSEERAVEGGGDVQEAVLDANEADVAGFAHGHVDGALFIRIGEGLHDASGADAGAGRGVVASAGSEPRSTPARPEAIRTMRARVERVRVQRRG